MEPFEPALYRCPRCKKLVTMWQGEKPKKWIKSYCEKTGIDTHLILVEEEAWNQQ